jgi:glycine/D-amino acid oxidase-like deaminating enzyme
LGVSDQETEILIVGQGICGTFLSYWLEQAGISYLVIDDSNPFSASRSAAGLINPVTGRRLVSTWMIDNLMPFAMDAYDRIGKDLGAGLPIPGIEKKEARAKATGANFLRPASVIDFFPTPQMRLAFLKRMEEDTQYLELPANEHDWDELFRYELGYGIIRPCYLVDLPGLLDAWRKRLRLKGALIEEKLRATSCELRADGRVRYDDISARMIVFCDGVAGAENPFFSKLPFAPNKGEALIIEASGLGAASSELRASSDEQHAGTSPATRDHPVPIFKKGISLVPWKEGMYWVGSSYEWDFKEPGPTEIFRKRTEAILSEWLKKPFRVVDHIASVRPATLERRPFVGLHPLYPQVAILNGMGTKGCSLAPYFARQLVDFIKHGHPIQADADVRRFEKVLTRGL